MTTPWHHRFDGRWLPPMVRASVPACNIDDEAERLLEIVSGLPAH